MKSKLFIITTILFLSLPLFAQCYAKVWDKLNYLVGNWEGDASGTPGEGESYFSSVYI